MNKLEAMALAEKATLQSYLNCFLRETNSGNLSEGAPVALRKKHNGKWIHVRLHKQNSNLYIPASYLSETGRHLLEYPVYCENEEIDYITCIVKTMKELDSNSAEKNEELLLRVKQSCESMAQFLEERAKDEEELYQTSFDFIAAEQSLLFGHLLHPTPKSRQGMTDSDIKTYSPELKGAFPLHYFRAHAESIYSKSTMPKSAIDLIKQLVKDDPEIDDAFKEKYAGEDEYALLPIHPWQAEYLLRDSSVQEFIQAGKLENLGRQGRTFYATSSLRTVYHPDVEFMLKFSLNIKITNSVRANLLKELERGVEVKELMGTQLGIELSEHYPDFEIIHDPAFITLKMHDQKESGFEVILRENPFYKKRAEQATALVALCQDGISPQSSRLASIIRDLSKKENRSTKEISSDWLKRYLAISLKPILWLYFKKGIALEAHQQNSVVKLENGYPSRFFYRDNQGFYFCESKHDELNSYLPGIGLKSETVCSDAVADERLRYYFFFNHLFGLVNAFGTANLADEKDLLNLIREELEQQPLPANHPSLLLKTLLENGTLPCKANLLTRFHDLDELVGPLETQSVYVQVRNPLMTKKEAFPTK
ncbi:IucA/IucC family siderophore biosynthesis protein [Bacillus idriensis]|uniref:IucA/IucC family siderophore biosynthesis protein n=1 Tax=Metabacillus idriensis TaxID=324768 RepID=A0A6I2M809_9BACI|nr:IucA/IucC family siderophore biosynthesis protein [Metabacillus idriensis]MRX53959.1 IucA/IucC family siderophore biosynthesis protein [Metabacillus idriensis]